MRLALLAAVLLLPSLAAAQAPAPMPASLHAHIGLPGSPGRFANVGIDFGTTAWELSGCISSGGGCRATRSVTLTAAQRTELVRLWQEVATMGRCEPAGFHPGDPEYTIDTPAASYSGHLPAAAADVPARTTGPCLADARLAWWLVQTFGP
jgi:hypothetical protein